LADLTPRVLKWTQLSYHLVHILMISSLQLHRSMRYFIAGYILISCVYCLFHVLPTSISSKILPRLHSSSIKGPYGITNEEEDNLEIWGRERIVWPFASQQLLPGLNLRSNKPYTTESSFLSKAFDHSMQPSKVVPFYFRATGIDGTGEFRTKDISIMTIVTSNRFPILGRLAQRYHGSSP
jgi:hypothetical protein